MLSSWAKTLQNQVNQIIGTDTSLIDQIKKRIDDTQDVSKMI